MSPALISDPAALTSNLPIHETHRKRRAAERRRYSFGVFSSALQYIVALRRIHTLHAIKSFLQPEHVNAFVLFPS